MNSCNIQHSNTLSSELDHITAIDQISSFSTPLKPICTTGLLFEFSDERLADDAVAATDTNRATSRNRADKPVKQTAAKPSKQLEKHPCQTKSQCGKSIYIYMFIYTSFVCLLVFTHSVRNHGEIHPHLPVPRTQALAFRCPQPENDTRLEDVCIGRGGPPHTNGLVCLWVLSIIQKPMFCWSCWSALRWTARGVTKPERFRPQLWDRTRLSWGPFPITNQWL